MRLIFKITAILFLILPTVSFANSKNELNQTQSELNKIKSEELKQKKLTKKLNSEINKLRNLTKNIARQNQEYEQQLSKLEKNISELNEAYEDKLLTLRENTQKLSSILISLQRISKNPENSIILYPGSPKKAVQSSVVLQTLLKRVNTIRENIKSDIDKLNVLQNDLSIKKDSFLQKQKKLANNRKKLNKQIGNKRLLQSKTNKKIANLQKESKSLSAKIKNIKQFLAKIEAENKKRKIKRIRKPESVKNFPVRGKIESPVTGRIIKLFGAKSISGKNETGITIKTQPQASVINPFDGYVAFSGSFKQLGNVIIISHEGGYNSVLIGLDKLYVDKGSWILTGEAIGQMAKIDPKLHFEIRYGTKPKNPLRWVNRKMLRN